jgi:hypothetical protein
MIGLAGPGFIERLSRSLDRIHSLKREHSTFTWLLEQMLERAGFQVETQEISDDQIVAST